MADYSLLQVFGEVGTDLTRWPTAKHFTAWMGLAPVVGKAASAVGHEARQCNRVGRLKGTQPGSKRNRRRQV